MRGTVLAEGLISPEDLEIYRCVNSAEEVLEVLDEWESRNGGPPPVKDGGEVT